MVPVFSCAVMVEPSDFTILHITYRRFRRKSMYSLPYPGTVISIGASSVSKELPGLHSLKYILSKATWLGGTVNNAYSAGSLMSVIMSLKKAILILV